MRRFHLVAGAALVVTFLLTGQYMDTVHDHLRGMADGPRLLYRTRHIYVLFSALLNLAIGAYGRPSVHAGRRALQWAGSVLIVLAGGLFIAAFIYEPLWQRTRLTPWAVYAVVAGVLLHLMGSAPSPDALRRITGPRS
jgi:hypothetical protein